MRNTDEDGISTDPTCIFCANQPVAQLGKGLTPDDMSQIQIPGLIS